MGKTLLIYNLIEQIEDQEVIALLRVGLALRYDLYKVHQSWSKFLGWIDWCQGKLLKDIYAQPKRNQEQEYKNF